MKQRKDDCIFCKIAAGDIPSATIYEDEDFKVFLDISPAAKGHLILIPKNHSENIYELSEDDASKVFVLASKIGKVLKDEIGCEGLNILQNNGAAAGQTVFHFHMHLIPRYQVDSVKISWDEESYADGEMDQLVNAIRNRL